MTIPRPPHATYLKLVKAFPLRSVRTDTDLAAAQTVLDAGGREYLDALTDLVEWYEAEAHPIPDSPASDVLELLLASNGSRNRPTRAWRRRNTAWDCSRRVASVCHDR